MPLTFHPGPGTIVICDFSTGFQVPEMVKVRPVVIVSPRRRYAGLATVVPLSSVAPAPIEAWHHLLSHGAYPPARSQMWAKCDMVATVSLARLDRIMVKTRGVRTYHTFAMPQVDQDAILRGVKIALGIP